MKIATDGSTEPDAQVSLPITASITISSMTSVVC